MRYYTYKNNNNTINIQRTMMRVFKTFDPITDIFSDLSLPLYSYINK